MNNFALFKKLIIWPALAGLIAISAPIQAITSDAAVSQNTAKVSFTFDDGLTSAIGKAAPILSKYGISGTDYVITGCVGMTTAPNKCKASNNKTYMTWEQINTLQSKY